jgi:hypothetical protein
MLWRAFDKTVWRKTLALAADAALWDFNWLLAVIDWIKGSCQNDTKTKTLNKDTTLRHDSRSVAREASAAPAASFKRGSGKFWPYRLPSQALRVIAETNWVWLMGWTPASSSSPSRLLRFRDSAQFSTETAWIWLTQTIESTEEGGNKMLSRPPDPSVKKAEGRVGITFCVNHWK